MKRRMIGAMAPAILLLGLTACGQPGEPPADSETPSSPPPASEPPAATAAEPGQDGDPALARARAAAMAFSSELRETLGNAIRTSGPTGGIEVCHGEAPRIAERVMGEHGVLLGRMSVPGRNRNPAQDAAGWQATVIDEFVTAVAAGEPAGEQLRVIRDDLPDGVALRMVRGIAMEPQCQLCHGRDIPQDVAAAIGERYPGDRATGFDVGDLRGVLWVEVPAG